MSDASIADVCVLACAEAWRGDGEVMASPFGSVPALGARVAKSTFSPDLVLTDGEAALVAGTPAINSRSDELIREAYVPYRSIFAIVWSGRRHIMMMASQVDQFGNQNIAAIGPHDHPKAQLVGVRGAPGNSVNHATSYWVPTHNAKAFVPAVDVVCGVGNDRAAAAGSGATRFHDLRRVISNLGVFDFGGPGGSMRLVSAHPGVSVEDIVEATGFELDGVDGEVATTAVPTAKQLALIDELDPRGARNREVPA